MKVWRATHRRHLATAWSGEGARLQGGRWSSPGRPVVYASEHAALAVLEVLVHASARELALLRLCAADLDEGSVEDVPERGLPPGWGAYPHTPASQRVGDAWLAAGEHVALRVPSALVPGWNCLLNPAHPDFAELLPEPGGREIPHARRSHAMGSAARKGTP